MIGNRGQFRISADSLRNFMHVDIFERMMVLDVKEHKEFDDYIYVALHPSFRTIAFTHEPVPSYNCQYNHGTEKLSWTPNKQKGDFHGGMRIRAAFSSITFSQDGMRFFNLNAGALRCIEHRLTHAWNPESKRDLSFHDIHDVPESICKLTNGIDAAFKFWCRGNL